MVPMPGAKRLFSATCTPVSRGALRRILRGQVAIAERQRDRAPAADAVLLQQRATLLGRILLGLAADLDALEAEALDALQRDLERLGAHPVVRGQVHGGLPKGMGGCNGS